jgi:methyl-accepting chemotaxis protein
MYIKNVEYPFCSWKIRRKINLKFRRGLSQKISLYVGIVIFIGFTLLISIVLKEVYNSSKEDATNYAIMNSNYYAQTVKNDFGTLAYTLKDFSAEVEVLRKNNNITRDKVIEIQKIILKNHPYVIAMGIGYEPNAFDGKDNENKGKFPSDNTGRFIPYVSKSGNSFVVEPLVDYDNNESEWYTYPKKEGKAILTEPYIYKVDSRDVTMTTIAYPIIDQGNKFLGVVTFDIDLDYIHKQSKQVRPMGGFVEILSSKGIYVANSLNDKCLMKDSTENNEWKEYIKRTSKGESFFKYGISSTMNEKVLRVFSPINIQGTEQYWTYVSVIPLSNILARYNVLLKTSIIISLIAIILIIIITIILISKQINKMVNISKILKQMANSDFTGNVPNEYLKSKDEIGDLSRAIQTMQKSLKDAINGVKEESYAVDISANNVQNDIIDLNDDIGDVSATTQQLSAGMEETAASMEQMNSTSIEIGQSINSIANKADKGLNDALEIKGRAEKLKEDVTESQKIAHNTRVEIDERLREAIKESKAIEQISLFTDSISQIASQTNLLALNAAIEAARAGEVGKGFAVVADEIRKLAEDSQNNVVQIQEVTNKVVLSVENLIESSEQALDFIQNKVMEDYNKMVDTGSKYYDDAEYLNSIVTEFSSTAKQLSSTIENMLKSIEEMTYANNEAADGTQNIAEKTGNIVDKTSNVIDMVSKSKESSEKLLKIVSRFKI